MNSRSLGAALIVAAVAALALAWGVGRNTFPARPGPPFISPLRAETTPPSRPPVDARGLRDVFRFADGPARPERASGTVARPADEPTPVPGPRLVGLIRRGDRILAALAVDGTVLLAGPGETVSGLTVVSVDEEAVRVRRSDGTEETLTPP